MMERSMSINDEEMVVMRTGRYTRLRTTVPAAAAAVFLSLFSIVPAAAAVSSSDPDSILQALEAVPEGHLLDQVAPVAPSTSTDKALTADTPVTDTVVPLDPSSPVHLISQTSQETREVDLTLPYPETSAAATPVSNGVVAFANEQGFISVPIIKEDGSAQVAIMVQSVDAPERYPFQVGLPEGASASVTDGGGVVFTSADGAFLGGLTPPWAKDANGTQLTTRYEVESSSTGGVVVTQVIEHHSGGAAYPVVADPWLGLDLFGTAEYNREGQKNNQDVLSVMLSVWGWFVYTSSVPAGTSTLIVYGWPEVVHKLPRATEKLTIYQQYACHVYFGYNVIGAGVHWDFEMWRPNNSRWYAVWEHRCNWKK